MRNLKRYGFAIVACMLVVITSIPVFAGSNNKNVKFSAYNAYGAEFISFVQGPLTISDKVSYTFSITGQDASKCAMTYRAGTPTRMVASGILNNIYGYSVSGTNVNAGYGNSYGFATMDIEGTTYEIHATN